MTTKTSQHTPGPPPFTEANRRKVDPHACACRVEDGNILRCPLHAAAPALLEALEAMLIPCPPGTHEIGPDGVCPTCPVEEQARAAIAQAK